MTIETPTRQPTIHLADFCTGMITGLASLGYRSVALRGLDGYVEKAFTNWEAEAESQGFKLRFWIKTHEIHRDSPDLRNGIRAAVYNRGLGFFTDSALAFNVYPEDAHLYLDRLPGGADLWIQLACLLEKENTILSKHVMN